MNETAVVIVLSITATACVALLGFVLGLWKRVQDLESDIEKIKERTHKEMRIARAPTEDLVKVVRCRDCKYSTTLYSHRISDGADVPFLVCNRHPAMSVGGKSYCDSGERREADDR